MIKGIGLGIPDDLRARSLWKTFLINPGNKTTTKNALLYSITIFIMNHYVYIVILYGKLL